MLLKEHTGGHLYNFGVERQSSLTHTHMHRVQRKKKNNEEVKSGILRFRNYVTKSSPYKNENTTHRVGKDAHNTYIKQKKYMKKDFFHSCMISCFSCVGLFATLWTVAHLAPLSMGFYRQEYWNRLHALLQGIFPTQLLNPSLCVSCISSHVLYLLHHLITRLEKMIKNRHTFY